MALYKSKLNIIIRNFKVIEDFGMQYPRPDSKKPTVMVKVECIQCGDKFEGQLTHFKFGGRECLKCFPRTRKIEKDYTGLIHGEFEIVKDFLIKEKGKGRRVIGRCMKCNLECEHNYFSFKNLEIVCDCRDEIKRTKEWVGITKIYLAMIYRCYDKNSDKYHNYGGRGIFVCDEWRKDKSYFYEWSIKNGYKDHLTIDRINNDQGYNPNNCRWTSTLVQGRNKRYIMSEDQAKEVKYLLLQGLTHIEIARMTNLSHHAISCISKGATWKDIN